jgi:hypothetical protein
MLGMPSPNAATPSVGQLIVATFVIARSKYPELAQRWVTASWRTGSKIPASLAMVSIQRAGELDIVCRALEDELKQSPSKEGEMDLRDNYLMMLSELWIGAAYAISFALKERKLQLDKPDFVGLAEDLRLIRVQIEKHQIPSDRKLKEPLPLSTGPAKPGEAPERVTLYDKSDPLRAHIGRTGVSERRSMVWEIIEVQTHSMRWIERRQTADKMLDILGR